MRAVAFACDALSLNIQNNNMHVSSQPSNNDSHATCRCSFCAFSPRTTQDSLCICMEYCDGGDLSEKIAKQRSRLFSESFILNYFVQMALGLHYMHSKRVLHRDLKTQNIFLLGNGRLVLGDLGISKVMEGTQDFARWVF